MSWIWKTVIGLVVVIILLITLKKAGVVGKDEAVKVSTEKVTRRTITESVNASGKVYPEIEVKVSPDISGEIVELNVLEGDSVKKGTVLAKIYADIYTTQRDQASAVVTQEQARVQNSRALLPGLKAAMDFAKKSYDRQKQLLDDKVISRSEFEQAQSTYQRAEADYNSALETVRGGQAGVASARANLQKADKDLSRTSVIAPMDGIISLLSVKKGERVVGNSMMAGTEMMRIADMSKIEVRVDVGENDVPKVSIGDSALVEVDAYNNRKFKGIVTQIAASSGLASQTSTTVATTSTDVTNYKVYIRLLPESYKDLIDPDRPKSFPFRPGMSASADIQTTTKNNVFAVPINAVTTRDSLNEVIYIVQADKTVKQIPVKSGIQDINYIEITSGMQDSMEVISSPYNVISKTLKDGMKVKVVPKEQLFTTDK
jgi:HlyD family secretion protein